MEKQDKTRLYSVALAIFVGVAVGFIAAFEWLINISPWLAPVGILAGGVVGYIMNDARGFFRAIPLALSRAWIAVAKTTTQERLRPWKWLAVCVILSAVSFAILAFGFRCLSEWSVEPKRGWGNDMANMFGAFLSQFLNGGLLGVMILANEKSARDVAALKKVAWLVSPPMFFVWTLPVVFVWRFCVLGSIRNAHRVPPALKVVGKFIAIATLTFFNLVHTQDRLICFVDTILFTVIAYAAGKVGHGFIMNSLAAHLLIFATLGATFGVLNAWKLKPAIGRALVFLKAK